MSDTVCRDVFRGDEISLQVLDRDGIRHCIHQEPYAVISITDPQFTHPNLADCSYRRGILRLVFSDVEERAARLRMVSSHVVAFTPEIARQVADYVFAQRSEGIRLFVINCEAGMSRSAGIATALSRFFNADETFFLLHYRPNPWVRQLALEALRKTIETCVREEIPASEGRSAEGA